ncbi:flagellar protein FliT [Gorillibacterium sp. CAU 1737]|uniref:flagellar protein FliT n=1 Tax=Gorillibacterium sp. CAU 1737 TaxID=3140362 RepID=UPI003260950E
MDELLDQLVRLTEGTLSRMGELTVEELEEWVDAREGLVSEILLQPPESFHSEERRRTAQLELRLSAKLISRMEELRNEASQHLNKVGTARTQRSAYDVAYTPESFYFDKKK